jgi:hypothetical protein
MLGATFSSTMLGSPILRSNLIVYDMDNQQIGFAPHTACQ